MSRHQLETYLDKVYDFPQLVAGLAEGRQFPQHPWQKVFSTVFLGAALHMPSLHQIEAECRSGVLSKRIGPISEDTLGYAMQRQTPEPVFALGCEIARRLKRNGVLRSNWSRGLIVAAVDGIEICSSFKRCCPACMERKVEHKGGRSDADRHSVLSPDRGVTLVSTPFPIPPGIRFQKDGEGEVGCAPVLLQDLVKQLGRRFFDPVVGDALYLQAPFVKAVEALGLDWAFTLKQNQPDLLREAERLTAAASPNCVETAAQAELSVWYLPQVHWPVADRLIPVTKTVRIRNVRRITIENTGDGKTKRRKPRPLSRAPTSTVRISSSVPSPPPLFISWAAVAGASTRNCFKPSPPIATLKQPAVHQNIALVLLTMIRLLAYTLTMALFHLQVLSHARGKPGTFRNPVKRLAYGFLVASLDSG